MARITANDLREIIGVLNYTVKGDGRNETRDDSGQWRSIPGAYVLDCAYGEYALDRYVSEGGATVRVLHRGNPRDLYGRIAAFISGYEMAERDRNS